MLWTDISTYICVSPLLVNNSTLDNCLTNITAHNEQDYTSSNMIDYILGTTLILGFVGFLGFVGNLLVIIIYGIQCKRTTNRVFIVGLALVDIFVCSFTLPSEVVELNKLALYQFEAVCKVSYFLTYWFVISSALMLIPLSLDRYNRTCQLFKPQWNPKGAAIRVCIVYSVSIIFSLPNLLVRGIQTHTSASNSTKQYCLFAEHYSDTWIPLVYNSLIFLIPVTTIIILIVIYSVIAKTIFAQDRFRKQFQQSHLNAISSATTNTKQQNSQNLNRESNSNTCTNLNRESNSNTCKITKVAFAIVVIFFLSYIPTSTLKVYESVYGIDQYSTSKFTGILMASRFAYLLNHIMNPFAYIALDKQFRHRVKMLFCC